MLNNIKEKISYGNICLINGYSYNELKKLDDIFLYKSLTNKQITYLNLLKKDAIISFCYNDYDNIFKCIKFLLYNDYEDINVDITNKEEFNNYIFNNDISECLNDVVTLNNIKLKKYIEYEETLYNMIKPTINLSNYEKFIYVYNIVKMFKDYKECDSDRRQSRDLYKILDNEYMVCVGYAELFSDLLNKININNCCISLNVDTSYMNEKEDELNFDDDKIVDKSGHRRVFVYLKDDKYKIDGYYLSDPTWDNKLNKDCYNHMLFTNRKNDYSVDYQWFDKFMLFNIKSLCEFNRYFDFIKDRFNKNSISLLNYIIKIIKKLEPDYFNELENKYNIFDEFYDISEAKMNYKKLLELKKEIAKHILNRANNEISELEKWRGIKNIYKRFYGYSGEKTLRRGLKEVKEYNELREHIFFPERYKIDKNNNKTLIKRP